MPVVNASTPQLANPFMYTSGWLNAPMFPGFTRKVKPQRLYWFQPDLSSTSSLIIVNTDAQMSGQIYCMMKCEVSGQSQQLPLGDVWWTQPFLACVPSGVLFVYEDD